MCLNCDYKQLILNTGLEATPNRLRVLEVIGSSQCPLTAADIHKTVSRTSTINRVTIYRILDLFVEKRLIDRLSGGRASYYGMAPNKNHSSHPHFYCTVCGQMDCLTPDTLTVNSADFEKNFPGAVDRVEVRIDGICKNCLRSREK